MKSFSARPAWLKVVCILLVLAFAVVSFVVIFRPAQPTVVLMPLPDGFPARKPSLLARMTWVVPLWAWRLRDSIRVPLQVITLDAAIFDIEGPSDSTLSSLSLGKSEFADPSGFQVWIFPGSDVIPLRRRLEDTPGYRLITRPRVTTAHGIQSQMSVVSTVSIGGSASNVGLIVDFLPRVRRHATDLTMIMTGTEAVTNRYAAPAGFPQTNTVLIQTNFAVAARIQIPNGKGVFLLQPNPIGANGKATGFLISATRQ